MEEREYYIWISTVKDIYYDKVIKLERTFGSLKKMFQSSEKVLRETKELTENNICEIIKSREVFDIKKYIENLQKNNIKIVTKLDKEFPERLKIYEHSPNVLFYKGSMPDTEKPVVAMIGARVCSNYGRIMAQKIGKTLSESGVQIVSGMARGIDTFSQMGAIQGGEKTFAVLGCGVDNCYPPENVELYNMIIENGGIISEYPPGTKPLSWHFPQRNRIISGMADKIAVIEAKEKSGSLITVEWALEQGKDIYAVPGRVDDALSTGCNRLLKVGAGVLTEGEDILNDLSIKDKIQLNKKVREEKLLEKDFALVYIELSLHPLSIVELIDKTQLGYEQISEILLQLQLRGLIEQPMENYFTKVVR